MNELCSWSAGELAEALRARRVSSVEVVEAHLARIAEVNPRLNAVVHLTPERALAKAVEADAALARGERPGALLGVPMTLKDSIDTAGVVTTGGTRGRANHVPTSDATVASRLQAAGAILIGKTNTPELTLAFETDNEIYGPTHNPYDLTRSSGGSSGGAAAIIAAGGSPFDIGSDTGGSIRQPAHYCGIAGLRPTSGRVSRAGHIVPPGGFRDSLTVLGPMARHVSDLDLLLRVIAGEDPHDPFVVPAPLRDPAEVRIDALRVAFYTDNGVLAANEAITAVVHSAARALASAGAQVEERLPDGAELTEELFELVWAIDSGAGIRKLLAEAGTTRAHRWLRPTAEWESPPVYSANAMERVRERWDALRARMLRFMRNWDVVLCPPCAFTATPPDTWENPDIFPGFLYLPTFNLSGWPAAVVRCGTSPEGLPIGVQIAAAPWREDRVLAVARHLETVFGGWQPPPW